MSTDAGVHMTVSSHPSGYLNAGLNDGETFILKYTGAVSIWNAVFPCIGISIILIRRSWDPLIFIMGIPLLVRRRLLYWNGLQVIYRWRVFASYLFAIIVASPSTQRANSHASDHMGAPPFARNVILEERRVVSGNMLLSTRQCTHPSQYELHIDFVFVNKFRVRVAD